MPKAPPSGLIALATAAVIAVGASAGRRAHLTTSGGNRSPLGLDSILAGIFAVVGVSLQANGIGIGIGSP